MCATCNYHKKNKKRIMECAGVVGGRHIGGKSKKVLKKVIMNMTESDDVVNRSSSLVKWIEQSTSSPRRWYRPGRQKANIKGTKGTKTSNRSLLK